MSNNNLRHIENINSLDQLIDIESRTVAVSTAGQAVETFASYASSVWANKIYLRGSEKDSSGRETDFDDIGFIIRYDSGINQTMRIIHDSIEYDIQRIEVIGRDRFMKIYTKSRE